MKLFRERYFDCNFTHFAEKLREDEGICVSDSSISRIMRDAAF